LVTISTFRPIVFSAARLAQRACARIHQAGNRASQPVQREADNFLKERLGELKDSLEKSEVALNDYRRAKGIIPGLMSLDGKETVVLDRVSELSKDLTAAQVRADRSRGADAADQQPQVRLDAGGDGRYRSSSGASAVELNRRRLRQHGEKFKPDYPPMISNGGEASGAAAAARSEISRVIAESRVLTRPRRTKNISCKVR